MSLARFLPLALLVFLGGCGSSGPGTEATPAPTALVTTVTPRQGSLSRSIDAYGTATPSSNGLVTLSVQQPGQVASVPTVAGTLVHAGQPLIVFQVAPSARAVYDQAVTTLRAAEEQEHTTAQLLTQQLATRDQLVQAQKATSDARTALVALRQQDAASGTIMLRAPFAGIVNTVPVAPGDRTQPGQALATVARAGAVIVTVGVDPSRRAELRAGTLVQLTRLAPGSAPIVGHVLRVDAALNDKTHQIDVDIAYPTGAFMPGEAVHAAIETETVAGWIVPHDAIVMDVDGTAHLFQVAGGKAKMVPVAVQVSSRTQDLVTGNIDPHAPLILAGAYQVGDGDRVKVASR